MAVLVLNRSYRPTNVVGNQDAINMLWRGCAKPTELGPEVVQTLPERSDIISYKVSTGFYIFNDIIVTNNVKWIRRKMPYPSHLNIWTRDNRVCCYCGTKCYSPTVDHVIPKSKGGKDTYQNLVTACVKCNRRKGSKELQQFLNETGQTMRYEPKKPAVDFALYYKHSKPHWNIYLFL